MKKKIRQKWLVKKSKFVWRKKNPPRAQIFRYFRIESRNKKKKQERFDGQSTGSVKTFHKRSYWYSETANRKETKLYFRLLLGKI